MAEALTSQQAISLSWSGTAVDIPRIESELARLRYAAAGEPEGGQSFAMRTSLLNLVVQAESRDAAVEASRTIVNLASHHPSRALLVIAEPGSGESKVEAHLAAHCHIAAGLEQHVCCEEVTLEVNGRVARHLHSLIIPLLVPDLPVYVWWTGPLPEDEHVFEEMVGTADRFIVDSARFPDQAEGLRRLAHLCSAVPECGIGDLNWERLEPWRHLLLQQCETTALGEQLKRAKDVKLSFASGEDATSSAQALLLLGWLSERLGWATEAAQERGPHGVVFRGGEKEIAAEIRSRAYAEVTTGELLSFSLRCADSSISFSRLGSPSHLVLHLREGGREFEEHVLVGSPKQSEILLRQLDAAPSERQYVASVERALPLARLLERG